MKGKILIVDDDADLLKLYGYALHRAGHEPILATSADDALRKIRAQVPDVLVLDVMLPGSDGFELCRRLRAAPGTRNLPIIMLTALSGEEKTITGLRAGADSYLTKPVTPREMVARVEALLETTRRLGQGGTGPGRIWGFIGAKGGVGTTTVALNIASLIAREEREVVAVELLASSGSFDDMLNQSPQQTLGDLLVAENVRIAPDMMRRYLLTDPSGMNLLHGPKDTEPDRMLAPKLATEIVEALGQFHEFVILDLPSVLTKATQSVLFQCELLGLVFRHEPAGIRAVAQRISNLKRLGFGIGIVRPILMQQTSLATGISVVDVEQQIGIPVTAVIPPAPDALVAAQRQGRPLAQLPTQNPAREAFQRLAKQLLEDA